MLMLQILDKFTKDFILKYTKGNRTIFIRNPTLMLKPVHIYLVPNITAIGPFDLTQIITLLKQKIPISIVCVVINITWCY